MSELPSMFDKLLSLISDLAAGVGVSLSKSASLGNTAEALDMLKPTEGFRGAIIRLGGHADGSYCIPDDLNGITHCFSPGVGPSSAFEFDLANRDIKVSLADANVQEPPKTHPNFRFHRYHIASFTDRQRKFLSMDDWHILDCGEEISGDHLLQMDIEGCEYEVIHAMSESLLKRFRIIVIEYHNLNQLRHGSMCFFMKSAFAKLNKHFQVCHVEQNFTAGTFWFNGGRQSRLLEVSYIRKDRWR